MEQFTDVEGNWKLNTLVKDIDDETRNQLKQTAEVSNNAHMILPLLDGVKHCGHDEIECLVNNVWKPTLTITGIEGLPNRQGGNVITPSIILK